MIAKSTINPTPRSFLRPQPYKEQNETNYKTEFSINTVFIDEIKNKT